MLPDFLKKPIFWIIVIFIIAVTGEYLETELAWQILVAIGIWIFGDRFELFSKKTREAISNFVAELIELSKILKGSSGQTEEKEKE